MLRKLTAIQPRSLNSARAAGAQADTPVECIFRGGTIVTVAQGQPLAEALAVGGGGFVGVGTEAKVMALPTSEMVIHDLKGTTITPGFTDSHGHFMNAPQLVAWANPRARPQGWRPRSPRSWPNGRPMRSAAAFPKPTG